MVIPMNEFSQATIDMARDWVNLNCPELGGQDYEEKVIQVAAEIEENEAELDSLYQ